MGEKVGNENSVASSIETEDSLQSEKGQPSGAMSVVKRAMMVASHEDSVNPKKYAALLSASRERRSSQFDRRGKSLADAKVGFSTLTIREHAVTVGDNPGGSVGPPLSIEWDHEHELSISINEYEKLRPPRRHGREMIIPLANREDLLKRSGLSRSDIVKATKPVNIARSQRRRTLEMQGLEVVEQLGQSLSRKAKNLLSFGKKKRKEKEFIEAALRLDCSENETSEGQIDIESA